MKLKKLLSVATLTLFFILGTSVMVFAASDVKPTVVNDPMLPAGIFIISLAVGSIAVVIRKM